MASQTQGIQQLLMAEKKAAEKVSGQWFISSVKSKKYEIFPRFKKLEKRKPAVLNRLKKKHWSRLNDSVMNEKMHSVNMNRNIWVQCKCHILMYVMNTNHYIL